MAPSTNWPNPEKIGVPMFPERDGWHNFVGHHVPCVEEEDDTNSPALSPTYLYSCWWDSEGQAWSGFDEAPWDLEECSDSLADMEYHGPCLTPTQISEMLAGERERCAQAAQKVSDEYYEKRDAADNDDDRVYADERMCAASECAEDIRNLGAAS